MALVNGFQIRNWVTTLNICISVVKSLASADGPQTKAPESRFMESPESHLRSSVEQQSR